VRLKVNCCISLKKNPLRNDANEVYAVLTILHDISDRVHAKNELQLLNESLSQKNFELLTVNEQLSTFAFVASHDLREPLRKIQVFTNSILESEQERLSPRGREYFHRILASIGRMSSMIDDILNFSNINAEAKSFHHIDLNELLNEVVGDLQEAIREQGAQINISRLPDYTGNRSQLHQLFQNLIGNAIKFRHPDRAPVVSVTGKVVSGKDIGHPAANSQKNYLQIQVSDNGIGFEEQYYNKIFQMFQRLHSVSQYSGTGMGLAICKKVVENHDGLITVHSTPGEGSEFTCHLLISDS
jgi:light-regulated signal transduction histidine kinase (bacteriophytochrome)